MRMADNRALCARGGCSPVAVQDLPGQAALLSYLHCLKFIFIHLLLGCYDVDVCSSTPAGSGMILLAARPWGDECRQWWVYLLLFCHWHNCPVNSSSWHSLNKQGHNLRIQTVLRLVEVLNSGDVHGDAEVMLVSISY